MSDEENNGLDTKGNQDFSLLIPSNRPLYMELVNNKDSIKNELDVCGHINEMLEGYVIFEKDRKNKYATDLVASCKDIKGEWHKTNFTIEIEGSTEPKRYYDNEGLFLFENSTKGLSVPVRRSDNTKDFSVYIKTTWPASGFYSITREFLIKNQEIKEYHNTQLMGGKRVSGTDVRKDIGDKFACISKESYDTAEPNSVVIGSFKYDEYRIALRSLIMSEFRKYMKGRNFVIPGRRI